jgi:hypothetical protein
MNILPDRSIHRFKDFLSQVTYLFQFQIEDNLFYQEKTEIPSEFFENIIK